MEMKITKDKNIHLLNMWTILSGVTVLLCLICAFMMPIIQKGHHIFKDFVVGDVAYDGLNKLGEWHLFWGLLCLGSMLTFVLALLEKSTTKSDNKIQKDSLEYKFIERKKANNHMGERISKSIYCLLPVLISVLLYGKVSGKFLFLSFFVATIVWCGQMEAKNVLVQFVCGYFAIESFATILAVFGNCYVLGDNKVLAFSVLLFLFSTYISKKYNSDIGKKVSLLEQFFLPFLLCIYLKNKYSLMGEIYEVSFSKRYILIVTIIIVGVFVMNFWQIFQSKGNNIFFGSVFSIYAFVSYMPAGLIMQSDLHHHGEQILAWQQIVELGQKAYVEYSPASGLFPMIPGFINSTLFHGQATEYGMSYVLFAMLFEVLIAYVLYKQLGGEWALFIAVLFHMPEYCRTWIFVPVLLILADEKLLLDKGKWLVTWVFLIFLSGLYYPLFGVALLLGTMPVGVLILNRYFKEKAWKKITNLDIRVKAVRFGVIAMVGAIIIISLPLLWRMMEHVLSMGGQTLDVDGKTLWGYEVPEWFMPYWSNLSRKTIIYNIIRMVLGIDFVMLSIYWLGRFFAVKKYEYHIKNRDSVKLSEGNPAQNNQSGKHCYSVILLLAAIPIVVIISYFYTMVCMDEDWVGRLLSRSDHVILFVIGMVGIVAIIKYGNQFLNEKMRNFLIAVLFSIPFVFFQTGRDYAFPFMEGRTNMTAGVLGEYEQNLQPYKVEEGNVFINASNEPESVLAPDLDDSYGDLKNSQRMELTVNNELRSKYPHVDFDKLGQGFVQQKILDNLEKNAFIYAFLREYDPEVNILGFEHTQFYYFLLNEKCVYSGRTAIAKSKKATERVIECIDEHTVIRGNVIPIEEYYLYRYIMELGYVYHPDLNLYMPKELYYKMTSNEGSVLDSTWVEPVDVRMVAASFGEAREQMDCFEPVEVIEPAEGTELANSIEVANSIEQVEGIESTDSIEQVEGIESTDSIESANSIEVAEGPHSKFTVLKMDETTDLIQVKLDKQISGKEMDFLNIEFPKLQEGNSQIKSEKQPGTGKVTVRFPTSLSSTGFGSVTCDYGRGKLLVPIGINAAWMNEEHDYFEILIENAPNQIRDVRIVGYRLK